jgi:hypothetical protein
MCSEQRATFQRVQMENDGKVTTMYSVTITRLRALIMTLVGLCTLVGFYFTMVNRAEAAIARITHEILNQELTRIHTTMEPTLYANVKKMITDDIELHSLRGAKQSEESKTQLAELDKRVSILESKIDIIVKTTERSETKIDTLLRQR